MMPVLLFVLFGIVHSARVVIVGAGMSGIAAASTLSQNGMNDYIVLEAQTSVGGRMKRTTFEGNTVEYGANWVEYPKSGNAIWSLANEAGLKGAMMNTHSYTMYNAGSKLSSDDSLKQMYRTCDYINKTLTMAISRAKQGLSDISFREALNQAGWTPASTTDNITELLGTDFQYANSPEKISLYNYWGLIDRESKPRTSIHLPCDEEKDDQDGGYFVTDSRGYGYLVEYLAKKYNVSVLFDRLVTKIDYSDSSKVVVSTNKGETFECEYVIVTVSVGVMNNGGILFQPQLPTWKTKSLKMLDNPIYMKIFLKFDEQFWDQTETILYGHLGKRDYYGIWTNLESGGKYFSNSTNLLLVITNNEQGQIIETQPVDKTMDEITQVLKEIYGDKALKPRNITFTKWGQNPLFYGSYSNYKVGITEDDIINLRTNVSRVYFSGEYTSEDYPGYVDGAYITGIDTANLILDLMAKQRRS